MPFAQISVPQDPWFWTPVVLVALALLAGLFLGARRLVRRLVGGWRGGAFLRRLTWAVGGMAAALWLVAVFVEDNEFVQVPLAFTAATVVLLLFPRRRV